MGIKNLNSFLEKHAKLGLYERYLSKYDGKIVAIDTSIFLYKFKYSGKFIDSFINQVYHLKRFNVDIIYIFDGVPPKEKQAVLDNRKSQKLKLQSKIDEMEKKLKESEFKDIIEKKIFEDLITQTKRKCIYITKEDIYDLKKIFDILGVKYIQADCEADTLCCNLFKLKKVDGCISNDMDFLPSGCGILLRNYNNSNTVLEYNLENILEILELSYNQFIDFCILCGCDYTCKIPRLGSETAFKLIKSHNNIENIIDSFCGPNKKFVLPEKFEFQKARDLINGKPEINKEVLIHNLEFNKPHLINFEKEINFIQSKTNFNKRQISNKLNKIFIN